MDYEALAKQYGGSVAAPAIDYDALARQFGGASADPMEAVFGKSTSKAEPSRSMIDKARGVIETGAALAAGAVSAPIVEAAKVYGTLTSGKYGTPEGIRAGEETGRRVAGQIQYQPRTEAGQEYTAAVANAMANTGLQGTPLNVLADFQRGAIPATRAVGDAARAGVDVAKQPLVQRANRIAQEQSAADWARAPKIEAAQAMQRLGIAGNPAQTNPSVKTKMLVGMAGEPVVESKLSRENRPRWNELAREDMGLPENTPLDSKAWDRALEMHDAPYRVVEKIPVMSASDDLVSQINKLKLDPLSTSNPEKVAKVNGIIDRVVGQVSEGLSGKNVVSQIRDFRKDANRTFQNRQATGVEVDVAEAQLGIANALEDLIESNISDPKALSDLRAARTAKAKVFDWERVTGVTTKQVDPMEIVKLAEKGKPLSGTLKDIAEVAGNYPGIASLKDEPLLQVLQHVPRTSIGGTIGGMIGGFPGAAIGAGVGVGVSKTTANMLARPGMQNRLAVPKDRRIPLAQNTPEAAPIPRSNALVPYDYAQETFEAPNFILKPNQYPPRATFVGPEEGAPQLGYGGTMDTLAAEKARAAEMSRTLGQQAEQRQAAAEAAARQPTSGAVELQINPLTGVPEVSKGLKGATPETFQNFGTSLKSASEKVAAGQSFAMDAAELSAWKRTTADLAEVMPGFKALDDKALAERMMDRKWVADALEKSRQKAAMFDDLAKRTADDISRRDAAAKREQLLDLADILEENLRGGRPVSKGGQGPKTRAHQRNMLSPEQETQNRLIIEISGVGQRK